MIEILWKGRKTITNPPVSYFMILLCCHLSWLEIKTSRDMTKPTTVTLRPAKTQFSLGICPVWSVFAIRMKKAWVISYPLSAQRRRKLGSLATHWAHSEDSDQTGRMPELIWVFAGRTFTLLVLSCRGLFYCIVLFSIWFLNKHCSM